MTTDPAANVRAVVPSCARSRLPKTPDPSVRVPTFTTSRLPEESISTALNQLAGDAQLLVSAAGNRSAFDASTVSVVATALMLPISSARALSVSFCPIVSSGKKFAYPEPAGPTARRCRPQSLARPLSLPGE
jgi:hypothetical protein